MCRALLLVQNQDSGTVTLAVVSSEGVASTSSSPIRQRDVVAEENSILPPASAVQTRQRSATFDLLQPVALSANPTVTNDSIRRELSLVDMTELPREGGADTRSPSHHALSIDMTATTPAAQAPPASAEVPNNNSNSMNPQAILDAL